MSKSRSLQLALLCFFLLGYFQTFAQADSAHSPYLIDRHIPDFKISLTPDSTLFTNKNLKRNVNTVFIMFNPDCEFCQHETRDLLKHISRFKKTQFIMVSYRPHALLKEFYYKYHIASYPAITMGKDEKYFFFKFFKLHIAPSTFVYDRHGNFKKAFNGIVDMDTLLKEL